MNNKHKILSNTFDQEGFNMDSFNSVSDLADKFSKKLKDAKNYDYEKDTVRVFMNELRELCFELYDSSNLDEIKSICLDEYSVNTIGKIYESDLEKKSRSMMEFSEEWETLCRMRSSVEFFNVFVNKLGFSEDFLIDVGDADDGIIQGIHNNQSVDKNRVPSGVPITHWWWNGEIPEEG
ncbi:hypothetical protein HOG98_08720 [bacterium]|jgi:hypothetical protein|nr:hypothetical protein [bacterium]